MLATAGGEAIVTAWPENIISTILYAFKIGGRKKKKEKLISESLALQSKQNMAPVLCNALCIIRLVLQLQPCTLSWTFESWSQHRVWMWLFWKETMLNGKQECQWCRKGLLLLCSYRREVYTWCPSNCCGSQKAEEFSSTAQGRIQRALGLKKGFRVIEVTASY